MTQRAFPFFLILFLNVPLTLSAQDASKTTEVPMRQSEFSDAEEDRLNARVNGLSDELKSPFCPGKTLTTCTSPEALNLRVRMKQMMIDGMTDDEIIAQLNEEYGEKLDNPEQPDYTVVIYILPLIFACLAAVVVFWSWKKGAKDGRGVADALSASEGEPQEYQDNQAREERLAKLRARIRTDD